MAFCLAQVVFDYLFRCAVEREGKAIIDNQQGVRVQFILWKCPSPAREINQFA